MFGPDRTSTPPDEEETFQITEREIRLLEAKRKVIGGAKRRLSSLRSRAGDSSVAPPLAPPVAPPVEVAPAIDFGEPPAQFDFGVKEFSYYRDVLHVIGSVNSPDQLVAVGFLSASGHPVWVVQYAAEAGGESRSFEFDVNESDREVAVSTTLIMEFASGVVCKFENVAAIALANNPVAALNRRFQVEVQGVSEPRVLEVGARARSGNVYRNWLPGGATYVGFDILPGENVDVVGDAHELSTHLPADSFDAIYSVSTMEHLAMPWIAAVEMNRVLKVGGYVFVVTHQTWPVHDEPWDFYRFSEYSWITLFNQYSGFEIVGVASGEPGKVVANVVHAPTNGLELQPAFLSSAVLARKVATTDLVWAADAAAAVSAAYPV